MEKSKATKTHKQTAEQKKAKELGIRVSKNSPIEDRGYTDEDVDFFASEVPLLVERLDMRRSDATFQEMDAFAKAHKQQLKAEERELKRLIKNRDAANDPKSAKKIWAAPVSPLLMGLFGGGQKLPSEFHSATSQIWTPLKTASAKNKSSVGSKPKAIIRKPRAPLRNPNLKGVKMVSGRSRARGASTFKSNRLLDGVRAKTWFEYLLSATDPEAVDQFLKMSWLNALISYFVQETKPIPVFLYSTEPELVPDLKLQFENWLVDQLTANTALPGMPFNLYERKYSTGQEIPSLNTLQIMESYVPGSIDVYQIGLLRLPLWSVLSADNASCQDFIKNSIEHDPFNLSYDAQFSSLLDGLFAPNLRPDTLSIAKFVQSVCVGDKRAAKEHWIHNPILSMRIESIYTTVENLTRDSTEQLDSFVREQPRMALAAFALLMICVHNRLGPMLQLEWLVMGLCCGTYSDLFSEDIQDYIYQSIRNSGDLITDFYANSGIPVVSFEDRWVLYGLI